MSESQDPVPDIRFQRSGESSPSGKLTMRIELQVSEPMDADIAMRAALERIPKAEYIRRLVEKDLYGSIALMKRIVLGNSDR